MKWISDDAVVRLRAVADQPDFRGTRYRLIREIGRGGMGVVYEAEDVELQRRVAVKVLATELASAGAAARMLREARTIARLEHPGIVPLHDAGTLADGRVFYAMKLVRGRMLQPSDSLRLFLRACEAVAFAHANGVVHCDLKPANMMAGEFGEVLVMDWGVAHAAGEKAEAIVGTRGYMPPEQQRGEVVDATADVYALGATLRELAGDGPRRLAAIIGKATAAERMARYRDAGELAGDLARFLDGEAVVALRENAFERAGRWLDRNRALVGIIAAYLVMRAVVLFTLHR